MNTIRIPVAIVIVLLGICCIVKSMNKNPAESKTLNGEQGFAVLELFTSEGCSSCPPADDALVNVSKEYKENVFALEFHVDYWNKLGWKDEFSKAAFSERQRNYAQAFDKDGVYTPQLIVNGSIQFVGSDRDKLNSEIRNALTNYVNTAPVISIRSIKNSIVEAEYTVKETSNNSVLNIALVQLHAVTDVKRGENGGRRLSHLNVVRDFKTVGLKSATGLVNLIIPAGLNAAACKIIAYTQDIHSLKIRGAAAFTIK